MRLGEEILPGNWNCESAGWCRAASWEELAPVSAFIDSTQNDVGFSLKAWKCHSHTKCFGVNMSRDLKELSTFVEFRDNQRRPSRLWEDKRVEPFSLKLLKHLKTQHVAGGGGLQTLDHLPISRCQLWNFQDGLTGPSTLRSLNIIRKWLGILGAFWSLGGCQPVTIKYI